MHLEALPFTPVVTPIESMIILSLGAAAGATIYDSANFTNGRILLMGAAAGVCRGILGVGSDIFDFGVVQFVRTYVCPHFLHASYVNNVRCVSQKLRPIGPLNL